MKKIDSVIIYIAICTIAIGIVSCAKYTGRSFGTHIDDTIIANEIRVNLIREKNIKNSGDIHVKCKNGMVALSGTVENKDELIIVRRIAEEVKGVKEVKSLLKIKQKD